MKLHGADNDDDKSLSCEFINKVIIMAHTWLSNGANIQMF